MRIPKPIWEDRDDMIKSAEKAFKAYGFRYEEVVAVDMEMNCGPECVEADYNGR